LTYGVTACFLDGPDGRVFVLLRRPAPGTRVRGCVLVAPPFGDEMNKSRKLLADLGTDLARDGIGMLLVDLFGTGDSEGELKDADWARWKADLRSAAAWSAAQGCVVNGLMGIRLGCALAAETARELSGIDGTMLWQPVLQGTRLLDQFLRLRVAAAMMENDRRETTADLRQRLASGETVEVAGYELTGRLAAQLDAVALQDHLGPHLGDVGWLEVVRSAEADAPPAAAKVCEATRAAGARISLQTVVGEPFWSSVEIVTNAALLARSADFFRSALSTPRAAASRMQQRQG
jgi:exosortase A-associated hydrolase 2